MNATALKRWAAGGVVLAAACAALLPAAGCSVEEPCAPASTIVPGAGVDLGGRLVCLGQDPAAVTAALGPAAAEQDLGAVGLRRSFPTHHVTLHLGDPSGGSGALTVTAIHIEQGALARTAGGLGPGSATAAVKAELGEPVEDPLLSAWWYPARGISIQHQGGLVTSIQLTRPSALATGQ